MIAALTGTNGMFRLHEGSIKKEQHVEFLKALRAHLKRPLLIIWDGLKAHRSRLVREYLDSTAGDLHSNPNLPVRLLQSCPMLGPTSSGLCVYKAAVRGYGELAKEMRSSEADR